METESRDPQRRIGPWKREVRAYLELFALCGIAVAQPTLDLLGKNPGLFIVWRTDQSRLLALVALMIVGPPLALWSIEVIVGLLAHRARRFAHSSLLGLVSAVIGVEVLKKVTELGPVFMVVLALGFGALVGALTLRHTMIRLWLRFLAIAPVVFGLLFVLASPATPVVFGSSTKVAGVKARHPSRIIMVVMDEFPLKSLLDGHGRIDRQLYPNFAAFADQSTSYRNDTTVAPYTEVAVPAILTGRMPTTPHALPAASTYPENLFTILGGQYKLNVHESITSLCPTSLCPHSTLNSSAPHGFRGMLGGTFDIWRSFAEPDRTKGFSFDQVAEASPDAFAVGQHFVSSLKPAAGPQLDFLHVLLPHFPWHYLGTGQPYIAAAQHSFGFDGQDWSTEWDALSARQRHLIQVQAADTLLGQIVARLRAIGAYDSSMIVVTADHGASFTGKEPFRGVSSENYSDIAWTPLLIKAQGQTRGTVDDRCAHSIDVLPTMLEHIGAHDPWRLDGHSLLGAPQQCPTRKIFEWEQNTLAPDPGTRYATVNSEQGFAKVLTARDAAPGDPALRLYGIGRYASLVGRDAASLSTHDVVATATVDSLARYDKVVPTAPLAWWPLVSGWVGIPKVGVPLAVIANGRVAGLAETFGDLRRGSREYTAMIPTGLLKPSANDIQLARIVEKANVVQLQPIRVTPH